MITIIKESGFCHGVQSAIDRANGYMSAVEAGQKVYLYGDLVNNSHVMGRYLSKGFLVTNDIAAIAPGSTVIIRAHGVPQAVYENLLAKGVTVEDCTCAKVKNTHKIVEAASAKGSAVVVVGKKDHPEVVGICGWCKNAAVLETMADIDAIPWDGPVCVVGQTTCKQDWWDAACSRVLEKCP
ncbi:MAG: bifunctional 4-hydroxy-3-methylbut-2-enyl diphosphate reductase/30S ribosomal protein S1, partial [Defluviitaleaceae bacterium]|nr:bifunctional 4-hydroxy-3-methylbut-2-enyl diphosphate reductase/30S ribosomal protein S1 [Defluviitaleaceae bacterium]